MSLFTPPPSKDLPDDLVLRIDDVSKKFCRNLKRSMAYGIKDLSCSLFGVRQKEEQLRKDEFWALKDVNISIRRGESVGLIGTNGSGKTTLLRLMHGIFPPNSGEVLIRGRIGALIALGAGFHPHFTGRENVYLNGSILGIRASEIDARMDEIIEFSELGDFMDAPVSAYSSGMKVRLGFSVAAHMRPDILLIDEVLAVGDISFRNKCARYLADLLSEERTILFVSHNVSQVTQICERVIWMEHGKVLMDGPAEDVTAAYGEKLMRKSLEDEKAAVGTGLHHVYASGDMVVRNAVLRADDGQIVQEIRSQSPVTLRLEVSTRKPIADPIVTLVLVCAQSRRDVSISSEQLETGTLAPGNWFFEIKVPSMSLLPGVYGARCHFSHGEMSEKLARVDRLMDFCILPAGESKIRSNSSGFVLLEGLWTHGSIQSGS